MCVSRVNGNDDNMSAKLIIIIIIYISSAFSNH